jgi:hypothetical protein
MCTVPTAYVRITPLHPTVAAEFEIRRSVLADEPNPFVWVRGAAAGQADTLPECEKAALAYLRSLPATPRLAQLAALLHS